MKKKENSTPADITKSMFGKTSCTLKWRVCGYGIAPVSTNTRFGEVPLPCCKWFSYSGGIEALLEVIEKCNRFFFYFRSSSGSSKNTKWGLFCVRCGWQLNASGIEYFRSMAPWKMIMFVHYVLVGKDESKNSTSALRNPFCELIKTVFFCWVFCSISILHMHIYVTRDTDLSRKVHKQLIRGTLLFRK